MRTVIQIVPALPPAICGVGDYAMALAEMLRSGHQIESVFALAPFAPALSGPDKSGNKPPPFPVEQIAARHPAALREALARCAQMPVIQAPRWIVLHYVNYAYAGRGCPFWLLRGLQQALGEGRGGDGETERNGDGETERNGDGETERNGDGETKRNGDGETKRNGDGGKGTGSVSRPYAKRCLSPFQPRYGLLTIFHELYATGAPWRSAWWLQGIQKYLAREVCRLSAVSVTSIERYSTQLQAWAPRRPILRQPIFSNMGEPPALPPLAQRRPVLVVFGSPRARRQVYFGCAAQVAETCARLGLQQIWDIGPPLELPRPENRPARWPPILVRGACAPGDVSRLLRTASAGFLDYEEGRLAKSGIMAAYCAHGLLPVLAHVNHSERDGLVPGQNYLAADSWPESLVPALCPRIAGEALSWYRGHARPVAAAKLAAVLAADPCHSKLLPVEAECGISPFTS